MTYAPRVETDSTRIPLALIGAGWVGTHRHLPAIARSRRFRLVGVMDRDGERVAEVVRLTGAKGFVGEELDRVPWLAECRAVAIATSPHVHAQLITAARALGLHVLSEKPFTVEGGDAERLAVAGGPVLAVMHNFQFARAAQRLWSDLASGRLGAIQAIDAIQFSNPRRRLPAWYESLPLGLFYDESPNFLYFLRRAAPALRLRDVDMVPGRDGRRTPMLLRARFEALDNGRPIPVTVSMQFESPVSEWQVAVLGERGIGVVDLFRDIYVRVPNDGRHTTKAVLRTSLAATVGHLSGYLGSGIRHVSGRLDYGVEQVYARFAAGIEAGTDPVFLARSDAAAVVAMAHEVIARTGTGT